MTPANIEDMAQVCHEVIRGACQAHGDHSQPAWADAPQWQRDSSIKAVEFALAHPDAGPSARHDEWLAVRSGWTYGPDKDATAKKDPFCVNYEDFPLELKIKDYLIASVVRGMAGAIRSRNAADRGQP